MVKSSLKLKKTQRNIFKKLYSKLALDPVKKLPFAPSDFNNSTTKDYYAHIFNNKKTNFTY